MLIIIDGNTVSAEVEGNNASTDVIPEGVELLQNFTGLINRTTAHDGPRKYMLHDGNNVYFAFVWKNGSRMTLSMVASYDDGINWTSPLDIWEDNTIYGYDSLRYLGLYLWKEQLFIFWLTGHADREYRQLLCKKSPRSDWRELANASEMVIRDFEASNYDVAFDDDYIYLAEIRGGQWQGYFYRYDNISWSNGKIINSAGSTQRVALETVITSNGTRILYFYSRPYVPGYASGNVYLIMSEDGGSNWTKPVAVMDNSIDYSMVICEEIDEKLFLFASRYSEDEIDVVTSTDDGNTWTGERTLISDRGLNGLDEVVGTDFSIGYREEQQLLLLAFEGEDNAIRLIYSNDTGSTWLPESSSIELRGNNSYGVCLSSDGNFFSCVVDYGDWIDNIHLYDMRDLVIDVPDDLSPVIITNDVRTAIVNTTYSVQYSARDDDTNASQLTWTMNTNATWLTFTGAYVLRGTPSESEIGQFWINITVSDGTSSDNTNFTINVRNVAVNETEYPPLLISLEEDDPGSLMRIESYFIDQVGYQIVDVIGSVNIDIRINDDGDIILIPTPNWAGTESLTIVFEKDGKRIEREIVVSISNRNDPPTIDSVEFPDVAVYEGDPFDITIISDDPDIPYGDFLSYTWYVDGEEYLENSEEISLDLPAGKYDLRVVITDSKGETAEYSRNIEIVSVSEDEKSSGFLIPLLISLGVFVILVGLFIAVYFGILLTKDRRRSSSKIDMKDDTDMKDPDRAHIISGSIGEPSDQDHYTDHVISEMIEDVVEGREIKMDRDMIYQDIEEMKEEGKISKGTYEMIKDRMRHIT